MTSTHKLEPVRSILNDTRLDSFLRAACETSYPPRAIQNVCERLKEGNSLDEIFARFISQAVAVELEVKKLEKNCFEITFGFRGGHLRDGGVWNVEFGDHDEVISLEQPGFWIEDN